MSAKVGQQPIPFPTVVKPDELQPVRGRGGANEVDRGKSGGKSSPAVSVSARKPVPLEIPTRQAVPLVVLEMEIEDLNALRSVVTDQTTFEVTELYSHIKSIAQGNDSLPIRQGLEALEEQVRLREYLHVRRTAIMEES